MTPGGAARRLWKIGARDVLRIEDGVLLPELKSVRLPSSYVLHELMAGQLGFPLAIVHTHAGPVFRYSCHAISDLPNLPPTQPLGAVPVLGQRGPLDSACAGSDWTQAVTIPSVQSFLNDRGDELSRHGLAFFDLEHGAYVLGRSLEGTLVDLARLDQACRLIEQGHTARASRPGPSN